MAKGANQKLKLMYIAKALSELTDEEHGITVQEIISYLNELDINADRKTVYQDFNDLAQFGYDIVKEQKGRNVYYHIVSREFELPELKLLVDSVQSAKFITESKSRQLIKKLEGLVSVHDAKKLHRQVIITGRVKAMNERIYYNVDKLHAAIGEDKQIRFHYFQWNVKKEPELRHGGAWYRISPWALLWDDENYYLIGYDAEAGKLKHYRVDKMSDIVAVDKRRDGKDLFDALDIPKYSKGLFGMYGGDEVRVTIRCRNDMAGAIIDRFGKDVSLIPEDDEHFTVSVNVSSSGQFIGWIVGLGDGVKIISPVSMVEKMRETAERLAAQYM